MPLIHTQDLCKTYQSGGNNVTHALIDVNLTIEAAEVCAIVGPSGSGKSTLLSILGGVDKQTSGMYHYDGKLVPTHLERARVDHRRRRVSYILQNFMLIEDRTVLENVYTPLLLDGSTRYSQMKDKAMVSLDRVGMAEMASKRVTFLSGGERQRVAIARAIVKEKDVMLADEPTGQLDSENAAQIMQILMKLNEDGVTLVIVTHNPEISSICRRIIRLLDGRIVDDTRHY